MRKPIYLTMAALAIAISILIANRYVSFYAPDPVSPVDEIVSTIAWREDFDKPASSSYPEGWRVRGKPGTPVAGFRVENYDENGSKVLRVESDRSSGSLITQAGNIDLRETPFLNWRWKVNKLPVGADGRERHRDDQAIGIYAGTGSVFDNKSVSYRWDTETPRYTEGESVYAMGTVKVKWITLRNKQDPNNQWFTESRNLLEDYKKAWGVVPERLYISVSANSQYTGTESSADLKWVELSSSAAK